MHDIAAAEIHLIEGCDNILIYEGERINSNKSGLEIEYLDNTLRLPEWSVFEALFLVLESLANGILKFASLT